MGQSVEVITPHSFNASLAASHSVADWPGWDGVYRKAFPTMIGMHDHRKDGYHQRNGIDRSITLSNSKQILIDEKARFKNRKTGKVYEDILLESLSDSERGAPGWAVKELMADYIAYLIAPLGRCFILPVIQLQSAWRKYGEEWAGETYPVKALNREGNRTWTTLSVPVPVDKLFMAIGKQLRIQCDVWDGLVEEIE